MPGVDVAAAPVKDRRFAGETWSKDPRFDALARTYLAQTEQVHKALEGAPLDERSKAQWGFGGRKRGGVQRHAGNDPDASCDGPMAQWRGGKSARLARGPVQRHILRLMPERPPDAAWLKLGAEPGLCGACRHGKLNETRRGTAYLRRTRAAWDLTLSRYPRLPVTQCGGYERREVKP